mmetsp:Transcript_36934/g.90907  ORF Transcript_36934/g.90907 Transcript_36934/m.90907 type:complete len:432 (+) Transcript_36934:72-1367(+)
MAGRAWAPALSWQQPAALALLALLACAFSALPSTQAFSPALVPSLARLPGARAAGQMQVACPRRRGGVTGLRASFDPEEMLKRIEEADKRKEVAGEEGNTEAREAESQFETFKTLSLGSWCGVWHTYDHMGDQIDDVRVDTLFSESDDGETLAHEQTIWAGQVSSDCERCTDSVDLRRMPLGVYRKGELRKHTIVGPGVINGPSVLRSGAMSTEMSLRYGRGRVRVTFQHAPVRLAGTPETAPPDGLKIFRVVVARETLNQYPPTPASEQSEPPPGGDPVFWRGVSPFKWHAVWGGHSWTFGQENGHLLWDVPELEEADAWHGRPRGDAKDVWTLKLAGGLLLQCPVVVRGGEVETFRLAWLPSDQILRRAEARIAALEQQASDDDGMITLSPPRLIFGRVDALERRGDLPDVPVLIDAPDQETEGGGAAQ